MAECVLRSLVLPDFADPGDGSQRHVRDRLPPNVRPDAQGVLPLSAVGQACMSPPCEVTARGRQASESRDVDQLLFGLFLTSRRPQPRWPLRGLLPVCAF